MLILKNIDVQNFACFERLELELSTDEKCPLTIVRAENGSGKTTFLRALRWGFYGEKGLPGHDPSRFSVHPAWWSPREEKPVTTKVSITFETDGGTRFEEGDGLRRTYRLTRSVQTIARDVTRDDEPDFRRIGASLNLLVRSNDGGWEPFSDDADVIERTVDLLLPWGLRDFFFMDADEATDFVGGRENKPLPKQQVIEKTTAAINELLGLQTFQDSMRRVEQMQKEFQRQASKASGDTDLKEMQRELDGLRSTIQEMEARLIERQETLADLEGRREQTFASLQDAIKEAGAHEQLDKRIADNRTARKQADRDRKGTLEQLSQSLEDAGLLAGLVSVQLAQVQEELRPLHKKGLIPLTHISFVRDRLEQEEECICGESLAVGTPHRENVKSLLAESVGQEKHSNLLGRLYEVSGNLLRELRGDRADWSARVKELRARLGELDGRIADLDSVYDELDGKIDAIDREYVQTLKGELEAIDTQMEKAKGEITELQTRLTPKKEKEQSLDKKVSQRQKRELTAQDKRAAAELASVINQALSNAYHTIQREQVEDLSSSMNRLFAEMAANVPDEDFGHEEEEKATVRMIANVGVRGTRASSSQYEIFARNHRGRILPPVEINGASRRVLALSFILALCKESDTEAPLIADSLLNMMSGRVRTNTFRTTVTTSRQSILLLTRADLSASDELQLVSQYGGATYTLTGQWDAMGPGGDVVNRTSDRLVAIACKCGPREYCSICQRVGDENRRGWEYRSEP